MEEYNKGNMKEDDYVIAPVYGSTLGNEVFSHRYSTDPVVYKFAQILTLPQKIDESSFN